MFIPVITIDGPSGCGKGTIAQRLAMHLHWHWLDSGALYRTVAWAVLHYQIPPDHDQELMNIVSNLKINFTSDSAGSVAQIFCDGHDVSQPIRTEACAKMASQISAKPFVRESLLQRQHDFRQAPGLVADGRDMGTVIFPDAMVKFFLTATAEERAERRYRQLKELGINVNLETVREDLAKRDHRDSKRAVSPLQPAEDAVLIETSGLSIDRVFAEVLANVPQQITAEHGEA